MEKGLLPYQEQILSYKLFLLEGKFGLILYQSQRGKYIERWKVILNIPDNELSQWQEQR